MSSKTRKFESLLEAVPDALVGMDQAGVIRFVNRRTELLFGYDRGDLIGAPLEILVPESLRPIHEVHREGYVAAPSTQTMGQDLELRGRRRDGTQFPLDIALSHTDTEDGPLVIAAVRDITGRKKTEEAHQQSERLAAIVEHSYDAMPLPAAPATVTGYLSDLARATSTTRQDRPLAPASLSSGAGGQGPSAHRQGRASLSAADAVLGQIGLDFLVSGLCL